MSWNLDCCIKRNQVRWFRHLILMPPSEAKVETPGCIYIWCSIALGSPKRGVWADLIWLLPPGEGGAEKMDTQEDGANLYCVWGHRNPIFSQFLLEVVVVPNNQSKHTVPRQDFTEGSPDGDFVNAVTSRLPLWAKHKIYLMFQWNWASSVAKVPCSIPVAL